MTALAALTTVAAHAQETTVVIIEEPAAMPAPRMYNRFAMDLQFGANHAINPMAPGYNTATLGLFHAGLGARYMLNTKFGLRLGVNYDQLNDSKTGSPSFHTSYYRSSLEGVINLGNVLSFDQWTSCFGLLLHAGAGYSVMTNSTNTSADHMMNVVGGLTPQFKVGERWNLYLDATMISNAGQDHTYDYSQDYFSRGLSGYLYNFSVGVQYNFGPNSRYADWVPGSDRVSDLRGRVEELERGQMDDDNDGVVNHLDQEPNTPAGTMVDTKGRSIVWYTIYEELNNPDELSENFVTYLNTYDLLFSTDKTDIAPGYNRMLDNLAIAMKNHPDYKLTLIGHADDRGEAQFNLDLSKKRADVVKAYLVGKGVPESRITATGVGETQPKHPADPKTAVTREEERRVQFMLK